MSRIDWNAEIYSISHKEIDDQHQELFALYNNLHESLLHDSVAETTVTKRKTLAALVDYVVRHFSDEEALMERIGYPGLKDHVKLHREFSAKVTNLQKDIEDNQIILSSSVIGVMKQWITDHISTEDKKLGAYYAENET